MEFAKGLSGVEGGRSSYWVAGKVVRGATLGRGRKSGISGGGGEYESYPFSENEREGRPYSGPVKEMPSGSVGYMVPWLVHSHYDMGGGGATYWVDPEQELYQEPGGTVQFDVARVGKHYFANEEDIEQYSERARPVGKKEIKDKGYIRIYTAEDKVVLEEIKRFVEEHVEDSTVLQKVRKALADLLD